MLGLDHHAVHEDEGSAAKLVVGPPVGLLAAVRERVAVADVPVAFRGPSIALITAGLMSLGFLGFSGLIKG